MQFKHLTEANQSYFDHFVDSIGYSFKAFKAVWYFTIHAFLPDFYTYNGSASIKELNDILQEKLKVIHQQEEQLV